MKSVGIPLILTFKLDSASFIKLDTWRRAHFPPERNFLKAHLTIYHQLPGQEIAAIIEQLDSFAKDRVPLPIRFSALSSRQGFVGVTVESQDMVDLKQDLDALFASKLRAQDRQPYRPHVTVANKGSPREAEAIFKSLEAEFQAWNGSINGLELFHYRGGPWEHARDFLFDAEESF